MGLHGSTYAVYSRVCEVVHQEAAQWIPGIALFGNRREMCIPHRPRRKSPDSTAPSPRDMTGVKSLSFAHADVPGQGCLSRFYERAHASIRSPADPPFRPELKRTWSNFHPALLGVLMIHCYNICIAGLYRLLAATSGFLIGLGPAQPGPDARGCAWREPSMVDNSLFCQHHQQKNAIGILSHKRININWSGRGRWVSTKH